MNAGTCWGKNTAGTCWGKNTIDPGGRSVEKAPGNDFNLTFYPQRKFKALYDLPLISYDKNHYPNNDTNKRRWKYK
jgi:hypothetical protein